MEMSSCCLVRYPWKMSPCLSVPRAGSFSESTLGEVTVWMDAAHFQSSAEIRKVAAGVEGDLGGRGSGPLETVSCLSLLSGILDVFHLEQFM